MLPAPWPFSTKASNHLQCCLQSDDCNLVCMETGFQNHHWRFCGWRDLFGSLSSACREESIAPRPSVVPGNPVMVGWQSANWSSFAMTKTRAIHLNLGTWYYCYCGMAAFWYLQSLQHWTTYSKDLLCSEPTLKDSERSAILQVPHEDAYYVQMLFHHINHSGGLAWLHETNQPNSPNQPTNHPEAAPSSASCCKKILANASLPTKAAPPKGVKPASTRGSFHHPPPSHPQKGGEISDGVSEFSPGWIWWIFRKRSRLTGHINFDGLF